MEHRWKLPATRLGWSMAIDGEGSEEPPRSPYDLPLVVGVRGPDHSGWLCITFEYADGSEPTAVTEAAEDKVRVRMRVGRITQRVFGIDINISDIVARMKSDLLRTRLHDAWKSAAAATLQIRRAHPAGSEFNLDDVRNLFAHREDAILTAFAPA